MLSEFMAGAVACVPGVVAVVELFLRLPVGAEIAQLRGTTGKSLKVVSSSRISDHWKEKVTQRYSLTLLISSCRLFLYLVALLGAFCACYALAGFFLFDSVDQGISQMLHVKTQLIALVVGALYAVIRKRVLNG